MTKSRYTVLLAVLLLSFIANFGSPAAASSDGALAPSQPVDVSAPAAHPLGIAFVGDDFIDLTWRPESYPDGTFGRVELYRGLTGDSASMEWIASITDPNVWFHRDTGLQPDTRYYYRALVIYHPPSDPDTESSAVLFNDDDTTGVLTGYVYQDLALTKPRYRLGAVSVREGARFTISTGTRLQSPYETAVGSLQALDAYLYINGAVFEFNTGVNFGDSPDHWGAGWIRDTVFEQGGSVTVAGDRPVTLEHVTGAALYLYNSLITIRHCSANYMNIDTGSAEDLTVGYASVGGTAIVENSTLGRTNVDDNAVVRHSLITGTVRMRGAAPALEENTIRGDIRVEAATAHLEGNYIHADVVRLEDQAQATLVNNLIDATVEINGDNGQTEGEPSAWLEDNLFSYAGYAVEVYGGAQATLLHNELEGAVWISQEDTRVTVHQNLFHAALATCWTPVITVTENLFDGSGINVGSAFPLTCSGDASGSIARNTIQNVRGPYGKGLYITPRLYTESHAGLSIRHNCMRNDDVGAELYVYEEHGPVDLRNNWWGEASGPNHPANPGGAGSPIIGTPVLFDPWDTSPTYCRGSIPSTRKIGLVELALPGRIQPDGTSEVTLSVQVFDQDWRPYPNAAVGFFLDSEVGHLSQETVMTGADGTASVRYTAPALHELGAHGEVEIKAISGSGQDTGVLAFEEPAVSHAAEPRFHQSGWSETHALLPPDPRLEATLSARLTQNDQPVRNYTVTLSLESLDGVYDGAFTAGSAVVGPLDAHQVTLLTDEAGELWVKYRPDAQSSRPNSVRDGVRLSSPAFPHLASWTVETGMDLELVEVRRPGASSNDYVVMGQPEQLLLVVRDRLHPGFALSSYNDRPDPILDPETDYFLGVQVDLSYPARHVEFLDLLYMPHLQVPRQLQIPASFYRAGTGEVYLRTATTASNLPEILPWMEHYNLYWVGVQFRRTAGGQLINDTYAVRGGDTHFQIDNNYRLISFVANENLSTLETFFQDNPCNTNTRWGRQVKCIVGVMAWLPGLETPLNAASLALSLCEVMFNYANGQTFDAAVGAGSTLASEYSSYLDAHPELLAGRGLSRGLAERLSLLSDLTKAVDCFWAYHKSDQPDRLQACGLQAGATASQQAQAVREMELWVQGRLQSLPDVMDALVVLGTQDTTLQPLGAAPVLTVTTGMTVTAESHFSLVNDLGSLYLVPRGTYTLTLGTVTDTHVILFRPGADLPASYGLHWDAPGTLARTATLTFTAEAAAALAVDLGGDGSVDQTLAPTQTLYLDNPHNVVLTPGEANQVHLAWDAVWGATAYRVYYGAESRWHPLFSGYPGQVEAGAALTTSLTLTRPGDYYYFAVTALDDAHNESLYSAEVTLEAPGRLRLLYLPMLMRTFN